LKVLSLILAICRRRPLGDMPDSQGRGVADQLQGSKPPTPQASLSWKKGLLTDQGFRFRQACEPRLMAAKQVTPHAIRATAF
jgi:hypothetical protein